jgi:hypothetical protein
MGYLHIENLYRPEAQSILLFRECFALEKVHGTSAHVAWDGAAVRLFSGGEKAERFASLFDLAALAPLLAEKFGSDPATIYGEAYGGKQQGMRDTYGESLRFIAFDVKVGDLWLDVPTAESVALFLGLEFVPYRRVSTDLFILDNERDRPSEVAVLRGIVEPRPREGVVLRPPVEVRTNNGNRIIAKHKRPEFSERKTAPEVDPAKLAVLEAAEAIAEEWVTEMRLTHVLDHIGNPADLSATGKVIAAMVEDVTREASGEIVDSKDARKAIGRKAAMMFKARVCKVSP